VNGFLLDTFHPQVAAAMTASGDVAAVLAAVAVIDAAVVRGDAAVFLVSLAPDCVVNSPASRAVDHATIECVFARGAIRHDAFTKRVDHAAPYGADHVVLMGEESYRSLGAAADAKPVHRRFTDLWQREGERWVIGLRQATICLTEGKA
jgi:ketosteroid isomerase-like protein